MDFRPMRRFRQQLSQGECRAILDGNTAGVLSLLGEGGYPYGVPLSYARQGDRLYFHCAPQGHKVDALRACPRASFCVIDQDQVVPAEYTTYFRSVILFGRVRVVEEEGERRAALTLLAQKYAPGLGEDHHRAAIGREFSRTCVLCLEVEHMTGKEAIELRRQPPEGRPPETAGT